LGTHFIIKLNDGGYSLLMESNQRVLVMGLGPNFLSWVRSDQFFVAQIGLGQPSLVWVWKISLKNTKFLNFCRLGQKNLFGLGQKVPRFKLGRPLIYCKSKVWSNISTKWMNEIASYLFLKIYINFFSETLQMWSCWLQ